MSSIVLMSVLVPFVAFVLGLVTCLLLARRKDAQLNERAPETLSYKWGYFLGYSGIICAVLALAGVVVMMSAGIWRAWFPVAIAYVLVFGVASYGVLLRRKWGWMFHIPLSLNMGLWAFNSVYVHNRWREFSW